MSQALFRPVSKAVPDLGLICEIMLMAEGFQQSKLLSRKFIILYKLCEDLLSKVDDVDALKCIDRRFTRLGSCAAETIQHRMLMLQSRHYDWKLRAIKTTLYVAGGMKRASPDLSGESLLTCRGVP